MIKLPNNENIFEFKGSFPHCAYIFEDGSGIFYEENGKKCPIDLSKVLGVEVEMPAFGADPCVRFIDKETGEGFQCNNKSPYVFFKRRHLALVNKLIEICKQNGIRVFMNRESNETYLEAQVGGCHQFMEICENKLYFYDFGTMFELAPSDISKIEIEKNWIFVYDKQGEILKVNNVEGSKIDVAMTFKRKNKKVAQSFLESLKKAGFTINE